jgi:hypothetical protein
LPKEITNFDFEKATREATGNYFCIKLSEEDLQRTMFNEQDFLLKKHSTTHPEKYQKRIVRTENLEELKLGIAYLLYREEVKNTLTDAVVAVFGESRLDSARKIQPNDTFDDFSLSKLRHFADTDENVIKKFCKKMNTLLKEIERQDFYAPTYNTKPLFHNFYKNLHTSELLFPCQIDIENIVKTKENIYLCNSANQVKVKQNSNRIDGNLNQLSPY